MTIPNPAVIFGGQLERLAGGVSRGTISNWVKSGRLPPPMRIGGRKAWPVPVIEAFLGVKLTPELSPATPVGSC